MTGLTRHHKFLAMEFTKLVEIMKRLRGPKGCPWDLEQTVESLKPYLIEEVYEVLDAIDEGNPAQVCAELGDLLLQIVFHAQIAAEQGQFTIDDVINSIVEKMIRRHPHVFGNTSVKDAAEVLRNWSKIKSIERSADAKSDQSALAGLPRTLPALVHAQRIGEKASRTGFDWGSGADVLAKVREEVDELAEAVADGQGEEVEAELGDLLLALASFARLADINAEIALRKAVDRFEKRFRKMEAAVVSEGKELASLSADQLEARWQESKKQS